MWTPEFEAFVAPARVKPQVWRLIVGTLLAAAIYVGLFLIIIAVAALILLQSGSPAGGGLPGLTLLTSETPSTVLLLLFTFIGMFIGAMVAARVMHGRSWSSLFGPALVRNFIPAAVITLLIGAASSLIAFGTDIALVPNAPQNTWFLLLVPALVMVLIQTGAEEVLFRGYLQSQLAARFRSPIVWMVLPSLVFGALHLSGSVNDPLIFAATSLVGLLTADLTRVTGGIGAAWGLHFANNVQALLIVSLPGPLSGLSLFHTPFGPDDTEILPMLLLQDMVLLIIIWAAIRLWFARRR